MHLSDQLAARRRLYSYPLVTAPALMIIDIPPQLAGSGLAFGRYYPVIIETNDELAEFEAFLSADRPDLVAPDLLDRRPSSRAASVITFFEYAPADPSWPWLLLCHWPHDYVRHVPNDPALLARGAYTTELFLTRADLLAATATLVGSFGEHVRLAVIPPIAGTGGNA
jgi:hypothetical protein